MSMNKLSSMTIEKYNLEQYHSKIEKQNLQCIKQ